MRWFSTLSADCPTLVSERQRQLSLNFFALVSINPN